MLLIWKIHKINLSCLFFLFFPLNPKPCCLRNSAASEASRVFTLLVEGWRDGGPRGLPDVGLLWLLSCHLSHSCGHYGNPSSGTPLMAALLWTHTIPQWKVSFPTKQRKTPSQKTAQIPFYSGSGCRATLRKHTTAVSHTQPKIRGATWPSEGKLYPWAEPFGGSHP